MAAAAVMERCSSDDQWRVDHAGFLQLGTNGAYPQAALTLGNDGNFYGTTYYGGSSGDGTVFK
jgi:hypothetical protein